MLNMEIRYIKGGDQVAKGRDQVAKGGDQV